MGLLGYATECGKRHSGVKALWLYPIQNISSFTSGSGNYYIEWAFSLSPISPGQPRYFEFDTDSCELKETETIENDCTKVVQELEFKLSKLTQTQRDCVMEIINGGDCGYVAFVVMNSPDTVLDPEYPIQNDTILLGYGPEKLKTRPLKYAGGEAATGKKMTDGSGETVKLSCESYTKAWRFVGVIHKAYVYDVSEITGWDVVLNPPGYGWCKVITDYVYMYDTEEDMVAGENEVGRFLNNSVAFPVRLAIEELNDSGVGGFITMAKVSDSEHELIPD